MPYGDLKLVSAGVIEYVSSLEKNSDAKWVYEKSLETFKHIDKENKITVFKKV